MFKKIIILIPVFYLLAVLHASFFAHFGIFGSIFNLIGLLVILINVFIPEAYFGIISAIIGGFFWDIFSANFLGYHVLILLLIAIFIQLIIKKYVRASFI
jgi:rod shape-determining protein MreD